MFQHPERSKSPESIDVSRRRFARVGAAVPVVLGTVVSTPVLATNSSTAKPPYHCTVSGQMSGSLSRAQPDKGKACSSLGKPPSWWKDNLPSASCTTSTVFNGYKGLASTCWWDKTYGKVVYGGSQPANSRAATLRELLSNSSADSNITFMRSAAVAVLNAQLNTLKPYYPLTVQGAVDLYNQGLVSSFRDPVTGGTWDKARVMTYMRSLYA